MLYETYICTFSLSHTEQQRTYTSHTGSVLQCEWSDCVFWQRCQQPLQNASPPSYPPFHLLLHSLSSSLLRDIKCCSLCSLFSHLATQQHIHLFGNVYLQAVYSMHSSTHTHVRSWHRCMCGCAQNRSTSSSSALQMQTTAQKTRSDTTVNMRVQRKTNAEKHIFPDLSNTYQKQHTTMCKNKKHRFTRTHLNKHVHVYGWTFTSFHTIDISMQAHTWTQTH